MVREGRLSVRETVQKPESTGIKTFAAPSMGLALDQPIAAMPPNSALVMENIFPTVNGARIRGGSLKKATIGSVVESLFSYRAGSVQNLFAAGGGSIFDITNPADPDVAPTASVTGQTGDEYSTVPFATSGGNYLYAVTGEDDPQLYDGSSWQAMNAGSTPALIGTTVSSLIQVNSYRSRLYFVEKDSMRFWYLGVDAIGGSLTSFSLASVFQRGGKLLFMANWSQDAGDGLDDKAVFVTDLGEVAIYQGSNPGDADNWGLVGLYKISPPMGKKAFTYAGGDLVILTQTGMVPISQAVRSEESVLALSAISRPIEPEWKAEVLQRTLPWEVVEIPKLNMGLVTLPTTGTLPAKAFAVNLQTSRWGIYTGWDARCVTEFAGNGYFGANDGCVYEMESGGTDNGEAYIVKLALAPDHLDAPGRVKTVKMGRAVFNAYSNFNPQVSVGRNYTPAFPTPPAAGENIGASALWDTAVWDTALWDGGLAHVIGTKWQSVGRSGYTLIPQLQATIANQIAPEAEIISLELTYVSGGVHSWT